MSDVCVCGGRLGATGIGNCVITFKTTHNYILMPLKKADGTKNFIDISTPATLGAEIQALTTTATPMLERLYPLPFVENVTREKTERVTDTAPSGNIYNVQDGLRQNVMEFWGNNAAFSFMRELKQFGCTELGFFSVDINGTLEGAVYESDPTKMYPIPVMQNTFYAMYMYATDTTIQKLQLSFNNRRDFDETQIYYLTSNDLGYPATDLVGLLPATLTASNPTTTGVVITVSENTNSALGGDPVVGLLASNFTITNLSDGSDVPVTGATENPDGTYTLTYVAVTGTHTFEANIVVAGYDAPAVTYTDPS